MACDESPVLGMSTHLQLEEVGVEGRLRGHHLSLPDLSHLGGVEVEVEGVEGRLRGHLRLQVRQAAGG